MKGLAKAPVESVSKLLNAQCQLTKIGEVATSELFPLELKAVVREGELLLFYVQHEERLDRLVEYNCHRKSTRSLVVSNSHILSLAVADRVIAVLENKLTLQKVVV